MTVRPKSTSIRHHDRSNLRLGAVSYGTMTCILKQCITYLDRVLPLGEMPLLLLLLLSLYRRLVLRQSSSNGTSLLGSEVERKVFLVLIEDAQLCSLVGVDDSEDSSDGFSEIVAVRDQDVSILKVHAQFETIGAITHILVSFEAAPPAIFCTRSCPNSVFNSSSCFFRSSLPLPHSEPAFTFAVDCSIN